MLRGHHRGRTLGIGTDLWAYWDEFRAGRIGECEMARLECGLARSPGHCMTMGTASTMTAAAEALGMALPGSSSIPAVDSAHHRTAAASGARAVALVREQLTPAEVMTREAFADAAATVLALGRLHQRTDPPDRAGRAGGVKFSLEDFDAIGRGVPVLADVRPVGAFLREDFSYAGGLPALLAQLARVPEVLHPDRPTVTGEPFASHYRGADIHHPQVIRTPEDPVSAEGGVLVRISDARMSGTSYGTCVLHVAPESHVGGRTGDPVTLDVPGRVLRMEVDDAELERRRAGRRPPPPRFERGYGSLYAAHITQADEGCDFDFLAQPGRNPEPDPS